MQVGRRSLDHVILLAGVKGCCPSIRQNSGFCRPGRQTRATGSTGRARFFDDDANDRRRAIDSRKPLQLLPQPRWSLPYVSRSSLAHLERAGGACTRAASLLEAVRRTLTDDLSLLDPLPRLRVQEQLWAQVCDSQSIFRASSCLERAKALDPRLVGGSRRQRIWPGYVQPCLTMDDLGSSISPILVASLSKRLHDCKFESDFHMRGW
jgi:hypothetical protein